MQLESMLMGTVIIVASVLIGIVGVLADTQKNQGLKWGIFFLLLVCAAFGINREYKKDEAARQERTKAAEALKLANESSRLVENGILKQAEDRRQFIEDKENMERALAEAKSYIKSMAGSLITSINDLEPIEEAALKAKKKDIAEVVTQSRLEASEKLVQLAKKQDWITDSDFKKMAETLKKKKEPLSADALESIRKKMEQKLAK